jgi:hypothetical protein
MGCEDLTCECVDELLRFLPLFEEPGRTCIERWGGGEKTPEGAFTMPYSVYPHEMEEFSASIVLPGPGPVHFRPMCRRQAVL